MKKLTRILSLVLVFAMLALTLSSCGATPEERVAEAMAKMALAKKADCTVDVNMEFTVAGTTQEIPMTMVMKTDMTDENNPVWYMEVSTKEGNTTTTVTMFFKDGYAYTETSGQKIKVEMSYDDIKESANSGFDMTDIFEAKKDGVDESMTITKNDDGTLSVEMKITKAEFAEDFTEFTEQFTSSLGAIIKNAKVEVADTIFQLTVDKDNNITKLMTVMKIDITYQGQTIKYSYDMDFTYRPTGEDFEVPLPSDLSEYKEMK